VIHTNTVKGYFSVFKRAVKALEGAKGKRLTYRTTAGRRRSEERAEPEAPPF
jgi:hypothetical protein